MSAPKTNLDTQKRRHIGPLIGITVSLIFVVGLILWWQYQAAAQNPSRDSEAAEDADLGPATAAPDGPD